MAGTGQCLRIGRECRVLPCCGAARGCSWWCDDGRDHGVNPCPRGYLCKAIVVLSGAAVLGGPVLLTIQIAGIAADMAQLGCGMHGHRA